MSILPFVRPYAPVDVYYVHPPYRWGGAHDAYAIVTMECNALPHIPTKQDGSLGRCSHCRLKEHS